MAKYLILLFLTSCAGVSQRQHFNCITYFLNKNVDGEVARKICSDIHNTPIF